MGNYIYAFTGNAINLFEYHSFADFAAQHWESALLWLALGPASAEGFGTGELCLSSNDQPQRHELVCLSGRAGRRCSQCQATRLEWERTFRAPTNSGTLCTSLSMAQNATSSRADLVISSSRRHVGTAQPASKRALFAACQ